MITTREELKGLEQVREEGIKKMKTYKLDFKGIYEGKEIFINYGIRALDFEEATKEAFKIKESLIRFWGVKLSSLEIIKLALKGVA